MKIYTKTGDKGETSLAMGGRVPKFDPRVELYGTTDELNATIGISIAFLNKESLLGESLSYLQNLLFELGSELAGFQKNNDAGEMISIIKDDDIYFLEKKMDDWSELLSPLKISFSLVDVNLPAFSTKLEQCVGDWNEEWFMNLEKKQEYQKHL